MPKGHWVPSPWDSGCHPHGALGATPIRFLLPPPQSLGCHPCGGLHTMSLGLWVPSPWPCSPCDVGDKPAGAQGSGAADGVSGMFSPPLALYQDLPLQEWLLVPLRHPKDLWGLPCLRGLHTHLDVTPRDTSTAKATIQEGRALRAPNRHQDLQ